MVVFVVVFFLVVVFVVAFVVVFVVVFFVVFVVVSIIIIIICSLAMKPTWILGLWSMTRNLHFTQFKQVIGDNKKAEVGNLNTQPAKSEKLIMFLKSHMLLTNKSLRVLKFFKL